MKSGRGAGILEEVIPYAPSCLFMPAELGIEKISLIINEGPGPGYEAKKIYKIQNTISLVIGGKGRGDRKAPPHNWLEADLENHGADDVHVCCWQCTCETPCDHLQY